jgi:hypothetical protein
VQSAKENTGTSINPELRRTSSFDRSWEETVAESVANELVLQSLSSSKNGTFNSTEQQDEAKNKSKDSNGVKGGRSSHEEKKVAKSHEEKRSRPRKMMEFHNIKISQVGGFGLLLKMLSICTYDATNQISAKHCIISCRWNYWLHMKGKGLL